MNRISTFRMALRFSALGLNALAFGLASRALDATEMGTWALASTLTSVVMSLDLGLSSYLRNLLAENRTDGESLYAATTHLCAGIAATWALTGAAIAATWTLVGPGPSVLMWSLTLGAGLLLVRMPFNLAINAFYSFNEGTTPIIWEFIGFALAFALLGVALAARTGVVAAVLTYLFGGLLAAMGACVQLLLRRRWRLSGHYRNTWPVLLRGAWPFGLLQLVALGLASLPGFVVGAFVRIEDVTSARAAMVLCQTILALHLAHAMPIWTELSVLAQARDREGLARLPARLRREAGLLAATFTLMALVAPWVIDLWLGRPAGDSLLVAAFCVWGFGCGISNLYSLVLNGGNRPLATAGALLPGASLALVAAWPLSQLLGSAGVAAAFAGGALLSAGLMIKLAHGLMASFGEQ